MMKIASTFPADKSSAPSTKKNASTSTPKSALSPSPAADLSASILEIGSTIKAKVIAVAADGMLQVETSQGMFSAKSLVPLELGREFLFEVVKGGDNPLLSAAVKKNSVVEILRLLSAGLQLPAESLAVDLTAVQEPVVKMPPESQEAFTSLLKSVVSQANPEPEKVIRLLGLLGQSRTESLVPAKGQTEPPVQEKNTSRLSGALARAAVAVQVAADEALPVRNDTIAIKELVRALDILAAPRPLLPSVADTPKTVITGSGNSVEQVAVLPQTVQLPIKAGDFFKAVVDLASDKVCRVEVGGQLIDLYSADKLEVGKEVWFAARNVGVTGKIMAQPVAEPNFIADLARVLRPLMNIELAPAAQAKLQNILFMPETVGQENEQGVSNLLALTAAEKPEPEKIIRQLLRIGTLGFGEQSLTTGQGKHLRADFNKLVEIVALLQQDDEGAANTNHAAAGLKKTSRLVEAHYQFNNHPVVDRNVENFLFPCFFADKAGGGEWMFSFERDDQQEGAGGKNYQLSFYLSMSNLGDVFLEMSKQENRVKGVFSVSSDEGVSHIRTNLDGLNASLLGLFDQVSLVCRKSSVSAIGQLKTDLAAKSGNDNFMLVDVTA